MTEGMVSQGWVLLKTVVHEAHYLQTQVIIHRDVQCAVSVFVWKKVGLNRYVGLLKGFVQRESRLLGSNVLRTLSHEQGFRARAKALPVPPVALNAANAQDGRVRPIDCK